MQFLRNTWYAAMWDQDLPARGVRTRTILGEPLVIFRKEDGSVAALLDECPHRFAPLSKGMRIGDRLRCPYHGLEFDGSGACVRNPHGNGVIPAAARTRSYPVLQRHSMLWIWMGDEQPDPVAIPDYNMLDETSPLPVSRRDCIKLPSNYLLIADNLMDLSHVSFLHDGILGHEQTIPAETVVEQSGRTVTVTRNMPNVIPPGMFNLFFRRLRQPVDFWTSIKWSPPACMLNVAGVVPPGAEKSTAAGADSFVMLAAHILTPETETSTHYHFAVARVNPTPFADEDVDLISKLIDEMLDSAGVQSPATTQTTSSRSPTPEELHVKLDDLRRHVFSEQDGAMVIAQQTALMRTGGLESRQPVLLPIDSGCVRYRRVLAQCVKEEAERIRSRTAVEA